jgi:hypothetical protein
MGEETWKWFLPLGGPRDGKRGEAYERNARCGERGEWRRREEWPEELRWCTTSWRLCATFPSEDKVYARYDREREGENETSEWASKGLEWRGTWKKKT